MGNKFYNVVIILYTINLNCNDKLFIMFGENNRAEYDKLRYVLNIIMY